MTKTQEKTLVIVLAILLVFLTVIALVKNPTIGLTTKFVDVRFGGEVDVRTFIQPIKITELPGVPTIEEIYNVLEGSGYHYTPDYYHLVSDTGEIENSFDFWCYGKESLTLWRQAKHNLYADCECGSIFLCSLLRGYGYDARVFVGTVMVDNQTYGHAWVEVQKDGSWILLESTRGEVLENTTTRPGFYKAAYSFNESNVRFYLVSGEEPRHPSIPPTVIERLRTLLKNF